VYVDGQPWTLASGKILYLGEEGYAIRDEHAYLVLWSGVDGPVFSWSDPSAILWFPPATDSDLVGLVADVAKSGKNDLRRVDRAQLPADASRIVLHSDCADSWRVSDDESLFT
jgi:hypothetical protein